MRILVVGGGAIGGITAAKLAADVVVLDANAEHVAALRDPGLVYRTAPPVRLDAVRPPTSSRASSTSRWSRVKSPLHHAALEPLVARGGIGAFVSLGNGLIQDRMEGIVGAGNLLACMVEWGGSNVGPGRLVRDSLGGYMVGELDGAARERAGVLAAALEPVGPARVTGNVRGMIWSKLLINTTFTGLSAVSGLRYGGVRAGPRRRLRALGRGRRRRRRAGAEARAHPRHRPAPFDEAALAATWSGSGNVRPSMLQDLDAGRETEVDVVNGGVAARGRELGIPTPCNDAVVELVHSMERGERSPDPRWLAYVSDAQTTSATDS